jgi:hypothetical protein
MTDSLNYILLRYLATVLQNISKSIIGATVRVYRLECLVVSGEKRAKGNR